MARTAIPLQTLPQESYVSVTSFTAADQANDHAFDNTSGDVILCIRCASGAGQVVTVVSVADEYGRTGDLAITTPANGEVYVGPLAPSRWNQADGTVNVNLADNTGITFAAVRQKHWRR